MYPSQTSLIPVTVALTRFLEERGLSSMLRVYPYWYLGTPFRYLTGPVVPLVEFFLHKLLPNVSLFSITIYLIILSFLAGAVGWGLLIRRITNYQLPITNYLLLIILLLILPWRYFSSMALGEASFTIARNLLPYALITFWLYLSKANRIRAVLAVCSGAFLLLINISVLPILLVGLVAAALTRSFKKGKFKHVVPNIKYALLFTICYLLVATFWYTPSYWLTLLANPSIGGVSGFKVILRIFDLLRAGVPLFLAAIAVYFSGKVKNRLTVFTLIWILTFGFLTLFRFIGDPDFWMDWTNWLYELEVGLVFIIASNFQFPISNFQLNSKVKFQNSKPFRIGNLAFIILILILPFYFVWRIHLALGKPSLLSKEIPEGVRSLEKLAELAGGERVFVSGSTVFWADALYDINQVRGGVDQGAIHPFWNHAAYQLREGDAPEPARAWLNALGVSWVLVHANSSNEFYHDFRNMDKWDDVGELVWEGRRDKIYKISDSFLAWEVDLNKLRGVSPPKDGKDVAALEKYLSARIKSLSIKEISGRYIIQNPDKKGTIQVLVTYSGGWKAYSKEKTKLKVEKDVMGNILIHSGNNREILLEY